MPINERDAIFKAVVQEFTDVEIQRSIDAIQNMEKPSPAERRDLKVLLRVRKERESVRTS